LSLRQLSLGSEICTYGWYFSAGLGECNKIVFTNPNVDKTFGVPKQADPEGARELTMLWKEHKANPLDMPGG